MKCVGFTNQTHEAKRGPLTPRCPPSALGGTPQVFLGPLPSFKSLVPSAFFCLFIFVCVCVMLFLNLCLCVSLPLVPLVSNSLSQSQSQPTLTSQPQAKPTGCARRPNPQMARSNHILMIYFMLVKSLQRLNNNTQTGKMRCAKLGWLCPGLCDFSSPAGRVAAHTCNPKQPRGPSQETVQMPCGKT